MQYGLPKTRRLLSGDVTVIKHHPSSMIQRSVKILVEGLFEWSPNLSVLKNFSIVLDGDRPDDNTKKYVGFSLADRSSIDKSAPFESKLPSSQLPTTNGKLN